MIGIRRIGTPVSPRAVSTATAATVSAIVLPTLIVHWVVVGYAVFAQTVAVMVWGMALACWSLADRVTRTPWRVVAPASIAAAVLVAGIAATWWRIPDGAPGPLVGAAGVITAAWLTFVVAATLGSGQHRRAAQRALLIGLMLAAGLAALIAILQTIRPDTVGNLWIARTTSPGRAGANLLQPNHFATLCVWGLVAALLARQVGMVSTLVCDVAAAVAGLAVALAASRIGLVGLELVAAWTLLDQRLRPQVRWSAWLAMGLCVASWAVLSQLGPSQVPAGDSGRSLDRPSLRGELLLGGIAIVRDAPLTGVGWDELGTAWALSDVLTPIGRPVDHLHNLPLQLAAELGLPAAILVTGALLWLLWRAWRTSREKDERLLVLLVVVIGAHSLVEMPLWFAYFLLPSAWALGLACTGVSSAAPEPSAPVLPPPATTWTTMRLPASVALACAAFVSIADLGRALPAALPPSHDLPVQQRIELGRHSLLYGQLSDDLAARATPEPSLKVFSGARHVAIDDRLLAAWALALEREQQWDKARHVALRARQYAIALGRAEAECGPETKPSPPLHCGGPVASVDWRTLR